MIDSPYGTVGLPRARRQNRRRNRPQRVPGTVKSPCIGVCTLDEATGFCRGCHRSLVEIRDWMILDDDDRRTIIAKVVIRKGVVPE